MDSLYDVEGSDRALLNHPPYGLPREGQDRSYWMCFGLWVEPNRAQPHIAAGLEPAGGVKAANEPLATGGPGCETRRRVHPALHFKGLNMTFPEACHALAVRVGTLAGIQAGDRVLEVGCGAGDALAVWLLEFGAASAVGVEVVGSQQRLAAQRLPQWLMQQRATQQKGGYPHGLAHGELHAQQTALAARQEACEKDQKQQQEQGQGKGSVQTHELAGMALAGSCVVQGSATDLSFLPDGSVDAVVAIDCAYHFAPSRARFFCEAHRVLQPGGRLAMVDAVWDPAAFRGGWVGRAACQALAALFGIPPANLGSAQAALVAPLLQVHETPAASAATAQGSKEWGAASSAGAVCSDSMAASVHSPEAMGSKPGGFEVLHVQDVTACVIPGFRAYVARCAAVAAAPVAPGAAQVAVTGPGHGALLGRWYWGLRWARFKLVAGVLGLASRWFGLSFVELLAVKKG